MWHPPVLPNEKDTVLILAGDIDVGKHTVKYIDSIAGRFLAVVYVLGNHDIWTRNIAKVYHERQSSLKNVFLLQNSCIHIEGLEILGTTLWTDMFDADPLSVYAATSAMSPDFTKIKMCDNYKKFTPTRWLYENREARIFLQHQIDPAKEQLVVTHHAPHTSCAQGGLYNASPYYHNTGMENLIADAGYWIYGHTHHPQDSYMGDTRVISNPKGYYGQEHVENFDENGVLFEI